MPTGAVRNVFCIEDMRHAARAYLPRSVFDFVDGGSEREITLRANTGDFEQYFFRPRALVDVGVADQSTTLLGETIASPLLIAPMGLVGITRSEGDLAMARAAQAKGIPHVLSTTASHSIEQVAAVSNGLRWFQLYFFRDRGLARGLIERARNHGYRALVLTVDLQRGGKREKDLRNGFTVPPRITAANALNMLAHPVWLARMAPRLKQITMGNIAGMDGAGSTDVMALSAFMNTQLDPSVNWDDLAWLRGEWDLPLLVKGILTGEDARRAVEAGADGVIVSNHGGRQLDGAPSTISVLREVVEAVDGAGEVILDSGVRRGADVVKALARGAKACAIGKSALYGLAAGGQGGVEQVSEILMREIDIALAMTGNPRAAEVGMETLRLG
ncbi:MAG: alpha-hydroxy acid oxidase [Pseudomonadota bacterium]|nr:alpha-hydroxy acid oxidase [Pseudomonadota bacterium]